MSFNIYKSVKQVGVSSKKIEEIVGTILKKFKKGDWSVSIHFIGEKKMARMNWVYRRRKGVTDVLSFAAQEGEQVGKRSRDLGDIFICLPQIKRQSRELGIGLREELIRVIIHGILHLAGYEHRSKKSAKQMFTLQESLLNKSRIFWARY